MGKFKAKRAAKKEVKKNAAVKKVERKAAVKEQKRDKRASGKSQRVEKRATAQSNRINKRATASENRVNKRAAGSAARVNKRDTMTQKRVDRRLNKKLSKDKYGEFSPEEAEAINEMKPFVDEMETQLEEQGIPIDDHTDPVEIATKYVQLNPEMGDPLDDKTYDDAYVNDDDFYAGEEDYENFDWKKTALAAVKGALGSTSRELSNNIDDLRAKKAAGGTLTKQEESMLRIAGDVRSTGKQIIVEELKGKAMDFMPLIIIALILFFVLRKS